ncbi:hypothetical protein JCM3765_001334 [Sporobolomyces pararoseus]
MIAPTPTSSPSSSSNSPPRASPTSSTALPTLQTTPAATPTPLSFLRSIVSAETVPHHLVFTTLALLLASGLIVRRLHNKNRYRAPPPTPKGIKKRKQDVVKSILIAQSQEEGSNVASTSSSSKPRPRSGSTTPTTPSFTSPSTLLPSSACIVSTSAAIWNNLEKVGAALLSSASRSTNQKITREEVSQSAHAQTGPEVSKVGKEPVISGKDGARKGKSKKGKGVAAGSTTLINAKGSSSDMSRASSKQGLKDEGVGTRKIDQGVQVSQFDVDSKSIERPHQTTPTTTKHNPSHSVPPSSSDPPRPPTKTSASVQTSPRLLPYRPHSPSSSSSPLSAAVPPIETSSPAPIRPIAVPISFDLHASFQATPPSSSITTKEESRSTSPSLSSTPSRSPSISPSVSSGSPTGRRLSSTSTSLASTNGSKSRKQPKKAGPIGLNGKAIVGLPKPAEKFEEDESGEQKPTSSKSRANGRERPSPIPIPSNSSRQQPLPNANDSTPQPQRRLSTASSSAYSTSNFSLTSSGSPYSTDRAALPLMPPSMTMTPPDFARRPSSTATYDRDETLKWTSSASTSSRGREASLRGLGVDLDRNAGGGLGVGSEDGSVEGGDGRLRNGGNVRGTSPKPPSQGYFQAQPPFARHSSFASPDSSPHPVPRTLTPFDTPSPSNHPWLSQTSVSSTSMGPNSTIIPYPIASSASPSNMNGLNASRPPSRQTSLSVPLNSSQQQQLNLQQQQQAYAIAQVQAQAAAQYQHVVALQYQAQLQQQSQQRRKLGDEETYQPNGLVYPLSSSTTSNHSQPPSNWPPSGGNSHSASPMSLHYPHPHAHLSQAVSPTSTTFSGSNTMSPHTQAQMYQSYINQSAAYYLAASSNSPHSSPSQHHVQQQQQHPTRPRINSSVSAVAVLSGGGANSNNRNGSVSSPVSANSLASPRLNGTEKGRQGSTNLFSSLGAGSGAGGGTSLGDVAIAWKARAKEAEMEADRNAKELEIARWRLSVLEGEQQANEIENQEALRALATRAMRAEARIRLLEETRKFDNNAQTSPPTNAIDHSPSPSPAAASPSAPRAMELPSNVSVENNWRSFGEGDSSVGGPGSGLHPLSWLDLDSISFSTRPLNSSISASSRPPLNQSHSSSSNNRKRAGRNSHGNGNGNGNGRRQSGNHNGRRKSSNNNPLSPSLHLSVPSPTTDSAPSSPNRRSRNEEEEDEDEEDVVIVLNSSSRRPVRSPSRRSSYTASTAGGDESVLIGPNGIGGGDASSFIDEDDIPTIEFDSDPTSSRIQLVHPQHHVGAGGNSSSDSQNGSTAGGIEEEEHQVDYVGFLPGFLARVRASSSSSVGATPHVSIEEEEEVEEEEEGALLDSPSSLPAFDDNNHSISEDDTNTPEARTERSESNAYSFQRSDEKSQTSPLKILAPPIPFHSTPPQSPSTFAFAHDDHEGETNTNRSPPPPLYHPFPIRPSQIALPPSPTTLINSPPLVSPNHEIFQ